MNDYDKACRRLARLTREVSAALVAWVLRKSRVALEFVRWMDTRTIPWPGLPDRTCDTVARLKPTDADGPPWTFPLEFETDPDADLDARVLIYLGHLRLEKRPDDLRGSRYELLGGVIHLRGTASAGIDCRAPGNPSMGTRTGLAEVHFAREKATGTLRRIRRGQAPCFLLAFVPLMVGGTEEGTALEWLKVLTKEPDEQLRREWAGLACVFAELTGAAEMAKTNGNEA